MPWPDPTNDRVGNIQLCRMMGAHSRCTLRASHRHPGAREQALDERRGRRRHAVRDSGRSQSDHPLGGLGFAELGGEAGEQEKQHGVFFDTSSSAA